MPQDDVRLAVLIPFYNAHHTLERTLASLHENKEPHHVILVDDGSSPPLSESLSPNDTYTIIRLEQNQGVTHARNVGMNDILKKGYEYMACLDADDQSTPHRLSVQRTFLDENKDIDFIGSGTIFLSEKGKELYRRQMPTNNDDILKALFYNLAFVHSSMMFRTELFKKHGLYDETVPYAEDFEIVRRFMQSAKSCNLPSYLTYYTISSKGLSLQNRHKQLRARLKIQWQYKKLTSLHFYGGLLKTICLFLLPFDLVLAIKKTKPFNKEPSI